MLAAHGAIPAPLFGVLSKLPPENGSWTQAEKDKFKAAFGAMLDFCFTVSEHTEGRGELVLK
jgi:hypothetical protein